jgi:RimJ/RimL family protein N-acetyltransferase
MFLRDITMDDLPLYRELLTDPATMAELGGPLPEDGLEDKLRGIVADVARGEAWYSVVVPEEGHEPAGTVCVWEHEGEDRTGERISEIGWMVLPAHQGRGLASAAVRAVLERARAERRWGAIHAFPGVTNAPSNAICRKFGFRLVEERSIEYAGRALRANHWVLDAAS